MTNFGFGKFANSEFTCNLSDLRSANIYRLGNFLLFVARQPHIEDAFVACFLGVLVDATQPITDSVSLRRIDGREGLPPNAVSDRQSTHPTQARLDATVNLAATTISDLFPTTGSETAGTTGRNKYI